MKQLYVTDPSEHKFLVTSSNSPSTFSSIISSVLGLFLRFNIDKTTQTSIKANTKSNP